MPFEYKKVLMLGATSGIGWALAAKMVENGVNVIAVGRRQEKLDEFAKQYGSGKATVDTAAFDITNLKEIPNFAKEIFTKHPELDCVFLNSGVQRHLDWTKPENVDLDTMEQEMLTNYTSYMHLTKAFLPYLQRQAPKPTSLVFTTSGLALVPIIYCPNYCASKAALHHMILAMRQQMKQIDSNVKMIEVYPPAVQTELHDDKHQPEFQGKGRSLGMPLDEFTEEAWAGLSADDNEQVPVQAVKTFMGFNGWEKERQGTMMKMMEMMKKSH
ncbi:short-chain dehydrogenase/ reductase-like protein [Hortaea werneckii]|uniref:NAD(P)-binding protein n=2 Tax=Hortaea werneckii TaxID=91943 RepID=A0A3M7IMM2_HORWE|nr:short-chain dehydrogenase/ reductase-like protein [Hortaea werneckii]KAI6851177.1 short-chain dehydrogenase/ reductase-like protein [Hortaea werneckii]KAI6942058.1 short-chain dehydrogenase/ reductase-like protein [Hortaea werneckii]KAI6946454.1 short-chain dehydrogenase/ reductase-like protein [Hortaea werneckii]KAI6969741.1 short-chain dehydrogenase/ reductase-like protein [Hortaea werneckii]